ncbi:hypothetical protein NIIDMKKI_43950 [Mycobacterium kansasii]|uniref:Circularly permuted ATPgrasp domain-containing protein n=1 Tax=Mycobacterium kansasii TaxID=1768 RepID=A0A7G1IHJ5_MYCKA|nr:hypothetical protein NIIDMKKI_43950 [Mycobacterium kansasii]
MAPADVTWGTGRAVADADHLLDGYRTARAQQSLFDLRDGPGTGYDEFVDADGKVRPAWTELADTVAERGRGAGPAAHDRAQPDRPRRHQLHGADSTRDEHGAHGLEPGPWRLDTLPLVVSADDWAVLEAGLVQRSRLLDAVLADLYGPRSLLTEGVLPAELVFAHPGYVRPANGITVPGHQLFLHACDLSRMPDGSYRVNADWTQAPSGQVMRWPIGG